MKLDEENRDRGVQLVILSAERTLLSWLRLCLAFLALGFVLDRFGFYIRMQNVRSDTSWLPETFTFWMGIALVIAGAVTSAVAGAVYGRFRIRYARHGHTVSGNSGLLGVALSVLITIIGIVTAGFLFSINY